MPGGLLQVRKVGVEPGADRVRPAEAEESLAGHRTVVRQATSELGPVLAERASASSKTSLPTDR